MEVMQKLAFIADDMRLEVDETQGAAPGERLTLAGTAECPGPSGAPKKGGAPTGLPIHMAALPGGKRVPLLKSLLTSACERNCYYCPFRAGRDTRRVTFKPDEMAQTVVQLSQAELI
jgi:predicted DNA-binding helix-hairpin-helix protein